MKTFFQKHWIAITLITVLVVLVEVAIYSFSNPPTTTTTISSTDSTTQGGASSGIVNTIASWF